MSAVSGLNLTAAARGEELAPSPRLKYWNPYNVWVRHTDDIEKTKNIARTMNIACRDLNITDRDELGAIMATKRGMNDAICSTTNEETCKGW